MKKGLTITNDHGWTVEQLCAHERTIKESVMAKRVATIRLILQGYLGIQVASLLNIHRETISSYVQKFNRGGMDELLHRGYAPGRKPYLSLEEEEELKRMIETSTPAEEGYGIESSWDTRVLQHALEEKFSVTMSRGGIKDMLHRLGFTYTRPTYRLKRANLQKQAAFQAQLQQGIDLIKKKR